MTPVPLIKLSDDSGDATNSFLLDDSNSLLDAVDDDDDQKYLGWPFVECVVSIVKNIIILFIYLFLININFVKNNKIMPYCIY